MFMTEWAFGLAAAEQALALRRQVFVAELGIDEARAFDWYDGIAAHLLVKEQGDPLLVATGRIYPDGGCARIDSICVRRDKRGAGYGDLCARLLLYKAAQLEQQRVLVAAPPDRAGYYQGLGFRAGGEQPGHGPLTLWVEKDGIRWDGACKGGQA